MPPGIHNVYIFEVFNTASWSIVLGSPMLLFLQHLNATATIFAIAATLAPFLNILQIPSARFVERVGYRRFVLAGWISRSFVVIGMAIVAFLPDQRIDNTTRIYSIIILLFIYNTMRSISVCGMLPWFTHIVPENRRGEFLARDQMAGAGATVVCLFLSSLLFNVHEAWYAYGVVFSLSAVCAFISLLFLRRVPDVPVEKIDRNRRPIPWREIFFYPPFFKYIRYNVIINLALGGSSAFWVRYFKTFLNISEAGILLVGAFTTIVLALMLFLVAPLIDRAGNKPVLTVSNFFFASHFGGWALYAGGLIPHRFIMPMLCVQVCTAAFGGALWNLANVRMVMGLVPQMGRPHFLALYSVTANITLGIGGLFWGPIMDHLAHWNIVWGFWHWNTYSLFYSTICLIILIGLCFLGNVPEPKTMTWDAFMHELLVKTPSRAVSRLIGRLRGSGPG